MIASIIDIIIIAHHLVSEGYVIFIPCSFAYATQKHAPSMS